MAWFAAALCLSPAMAAFFQPLAAQRFGEHSPEVGRPVVIRTPLRRVPLPGQNLQRDAARRDDHVPWACLAFAAGAVGVAAFGSSRPFAQLGLFDGFAKAFENDAALGERKNPGLKGPRARAVTVNVCGKSVEAIPGQKMFDIVRRNTREIKFNCSDGVCGTCECLVNGKKTRVCKMVVPNKDIKVVPKKSYARF